jgi:hypothetical protein
MARVIVRDRVGQRAVDAARIAELEAQVTILTHERQEARDTRDATRREAEAAHLKAFGLKVDNDLLRNRADRCLAAEATVERVRAIHKPFGIWDECDCPDERKDDSDHVEIDEVGRTCRRLYDVCAECCVDNDYHTEGCADSHDHGPGKPICATIAALADPKGAPHG